MDFKNTLIIMTSNLGSQFAFEENDAERKAHYLDEVHHYFKPEFINRIDEILVFNALSDETLIKIADKFLAELASRLETKGILLDVSQAAKNKILEEGSDPVFGARPMKRHIQRAIETKIARLMIQENLQEGTKLWVDAEGDDYIVEVLN